MHPVTHSSFTLQIPASAVQPHTVTPLRTPDDDRTLMTHAPDYC